ncbi:MAG: hypothetical protein O3B37_15475 [Proteobacteria bacterium]|nr:hypothetical protein [Pseudomonadota bacterium]
MILVLILWGFLSFVFFKIGLDASFGRDSTVIATMLLGVLVAASVFVTSFYYAARLGRHLALVRMGQPTSLFFPMLATWGIAVAANIVVGKAIIFGFSKRLNRELGGDLLFDFGYRFDEGIIFAILVIIPITVHFLISLLDANRQTKLVKHMESGLD